MASCFEAQTACFAFFLRRARTAAAAAPNRIVIGGAGTGVPLEDPCHPLDPDEEVDELEDDELLLEDELLVDDEVDDELDVLLVMLPELDVLVDTLPEVDVDE